MAITGSTDVSHHTIYFSQGWSKYELSGDGDENQNAVEKESSCQEFSVYFSHMSKNSPNNSWNKNDKKREKNMWDSVCICLCFEQWKDGGERHDHRIKGNSTLNYIGPKLFATWLSVDSNFRACCGSGHITVKVVIPVKQQLSALFDSVLNYTLSLLFSFFSSSMVYAPLSPSEMLVFQVSHNVPFYLIHSSSNGLSDSSFSLSSSSGRSPQRSRFRPADSVEGDTKAYETHSQS